MKAKKEYIGIFGGSFDPVHAGHISVAQQVYQHINLLEIWFTPCFRSPFKNKTFYSNEERLSRLRQSIEKLTYCKIWEYEIRNTTPSYTYNTVIHFKNNYPFSLCLIMGLDSFLTFPNWYKSKKILENTCLIVINRPNTNWSLEAQKFLSKYQISQKNPADGKIIWLDLPTPNLASHNLRN